MEILAAIIGGVVGCFLGIFITCMCVAASDKYDKKR